MIDWKALSEKTITARRNAFIKTAGSADANIYFVESGSLRIYVLDENQEQIIRFAYPGNVVLALDAYLSGQPSDFYIQTIKKSVLHVIPAQRFKAYIQENPAHQALWIQILEDLVLQQMEREKDILTASPKARYLRVLKRSPALFREIPGRHIANYLRMSPETLSRLKKS